MWVEQDQSLFSSCTEQMKYDEFIQNELFDPKNAMNSLEVSHIRLDSHLSQEGEFSIDELKNSGHVILDEDATLDDIVAICRKFLTIQSLRLNGENFILTVLTSVYINKDYEIKNDLLCVMFKAFAVATYAIETYINDFGYFAASCWNHTDKHLKHIKRYDFEETQKEVENYFSAFAKNGNLDENLKILKEIACFELDLSDYLSSIQTKEIPRLPDFLPIFTKSALSSDQNSASDRIPTRISESGVAPHLYFRLISPSNPAPKPLSATIEYAHNVFEKFISEVNEAEKIFNGKSFSSADRIKRVAEWNQSADDHVSYSRFIVMGYVIFQLNPEENFVKIIQKELIDSHCHINFFSEKEYQNLTQTIWVAYQSILKNLILPIASAQAYLIAHGCRYWGYVQSLGFEMHQKVPEALFPKCQAIEFQRMVTMTFPLWSTRIGAVLLEICIRWGFVSNLYAPRDFHIEWYLLEMAHRTSALALMQKRTLNAIHKVKNNNRRKKGSTVLTSDVTHSIESPSAEEIIHHAKAELFSGYFHSFRLFKKWNCIDFKCGQFFNEKMVFEDRQKVVNQMMHFAAKTFPEFESSIEPGINDKDFIRLEANSHFKKSKEFLMQYIKMTQDKTAEITEMMRAILLNTMFLTKLNETDKVNTNFEKHKVYPLFEILA